LRVAARHPRAVRENRKGASHQIWAICTRQLPSFSRFGGWHEWHEVKALVVGLKGLASTRRVVWS
jgi:hypothetical protein